MSDNNLAQYYAAVEKVIEGLGVDPKTCRGEKPGQWDLKRGSAKIWVDILWSETNNAGYFQVMSPILKIPSTNREALFHEILQLNHQFYGVGFTVFKDWVYIKVIREVAGLDESEVTSTMNRVGYYADEWDDKLQEKYGE